MFWSFIVSRVPRGMLYWVALDCDGVPNKVVSDCISSVNSTQGSTVLLQEILIESIANIKTQL